MKSKFFGGSLDGIEFTAPNPIEKLVVQTPKRITEYYEWDSDWEYQGETYHRFVQTRNVEDFLLELDLDKKV